MCGGHSLLHLLSADSLPAIFVSQQDVRQEIKLLYARGVIDTAAFHRFMEMAESGYLKPEDLPGLCKSASLDTRGREFDNSRAAEIQREISRLIAAAEDAKVDADRPGLTPDQVRAYLETRQGALFRVEALKSQLETVGATADRQSH